MMLRRRLHGMVETDRPSVPKGHQRHQGSPLYRGKVASVLTDPQARHIIL